MIKLNNKNITYVALADTNNSIKAPKEIWYADTNNSVKLVYRRKDTLIDGEDYEKYHWLEGTNDAYISGVKYNVWQNKIQIKVGEVVPMPSSAIGYFQLVAGYEKYLSIYFNINSVLYDFLQVIFRNDGYHHIADIIPYQGFGESAMTFYVDNGIAMVEQDGVISSGESLTESAWNTDIELTNPNNKMAKVSYIRELLPNNTYRSNLIPCKLLKPVPKWLDANGIRRQVGECGMIDLVSGKFYGNVNSVGTFTVENYYERKEWLKGDGAAYIDVEGFSRNENWVIASKLRQRPMNDWILLYGVAYYNGFNNGSWILFGNKDATYLKVRSTNGNNREDNGVGIPQGQTATIVDSHNSIIINSSQKPTINNRIYSQCNHFYIFSNYYSNKEVSVSDDEIADADFSYFKIEENNTEILHLIPCTLTMDLPASMDANNIARTKGTSGMWDLVSDRFYGNVANSGTFKAVNLSEGVDYEVHQWLRAENPINVTLMSLPINSDTLYYKKIWKTFGNSMYFETDGYAYFTPANKKIEIYDRENKRTIYSSSSPIDIDDVIEVNSSENTTLINNIELQQYGFPILNVRFYNAANATVTGISLTSKITVDGVDRYIPVKLLSSIPAKYDANGIARQVGECGMYDTVNDVFYGNVASSGTFNVSDNE